MKSQLRTLQPRLRHQQVSSDQTCRPPRQSSWTTSIAYSHAYDGLDNGYSIDENSTQVAAAADPPSNKEVEEEEGMLLYGELTPEGVRQLHALCLPYFQAPDADNNNHVAPRLPSRTRTSSSFLDMGSGTGKLVFEVAHLEALRRMEEDTQGDEAPPPSAWTVIGIELSEIRHRIAVAALSKGSAVPFRQYTQQQQQVEEVEENAEQVGVSLLLVKSFLHHLSGGDDHLCVWLRVRFTTSSHDASWTQLSTGVSSAITVCGAVVARGGPYLIASMGEEDGSRSQNGDRIRTERPLAGAASFLLPRRCQRHPMGDIATWMDPALMIVF